MTVTNHGGNVVAFPISNPMATAKEQLAALIGTELDQRAPEIDAVDDELSWQYFMAFLQAMTNARNQGGPEAPRPRTLADHSRAFELFVVVGRELLEDMADALVDWRASGGPGR